MPAHDRDHDGELLTLESLARRVRVLEREKDAHDVLNAAGIKILGVLVGLASVGSFVMIAFGVR